ncbi:MAG: TIM barrel protein [Opitutae bacterium]|nr:TIM barrel protein [Opitutae bacterium]
MLKEMAALGFEYVELSHGIRITLVPGILRAIEEGVVKVSSCHNFCPLPMGVVHPSPNHYEPSSLDSREQDQWLRQTKRSLDFAAQVKARLLVCHLGSVEFFWFNPTRGLKHYQRDHSRTDLAFDKEYLALRDKALTKLRKRQPKFLDQVKKSISSVLDYAKQKGVQLGFENREKFDELPLDDSFEELLAGFPADAPIGYWHDTGHADIKESLALLKHQQHLEKNAPRLLGMHLHDVNAQGHDHQAIGSGHIDFNMVSSFWRPQHLLVLEMNPRATEEEITVSRQRIEALRAGVKA